MFRGIRDVFVLAAAGGMMWSCGDERVTMSRVTEADLPVRGTQAGGQVGRPLGKLSVNRDLTQVVVAAEVQQDQAPPSGVRVEFSRSVSGRAANYQWLGTADERGRARVYIWSDNVSGYYQARAWRNGSLLGSWSSIPINGGYELMIDLPVGGRARVTGSAILTLESPVGSWGYVGTDMVQTIRDNLENYLVDQGLDRAAAVISVQEFTGDRKNDTRDVSSIRRFNADGSYEDEDNDNTGTWSVSGNRLTMVDTDGFTIECAYFVDGDALTLFLTMDQLLRIIRRVVDEDWEEEEQALFDVMLKEGDTIRFFFAAGGNSRRP